MVPGATSPLPAGVPDSIEVKSGQLTVSPNASDKNVGRSPVGATEVVTLQHMTNPN